MEESKLRSLIKGITWRIIGTIDTMVISFIITGKINIALSIGSVEFFTKIILFYCHERIYNKINIGKQKNK